MFAREVLIRRFVQHYDALYCLIKQLHQRRERVAEETAHAQSDVNAGTTQLGERNHFDSTRAARYRLPDGFDAKKSQSLRDFIAACAHSGRSPNAQRDALRPAILGREETS